MSNTSNIPLPKPLPTPPLKSSHHISTRPRPIPPPNPSPHTSSPTSPSTPYIYTFLEATELCFNSPSTMVQGEDFAWDAYLALNQFTNTIYLYTLQFPKLSDYSYSMSSLGNPPLSLSLLTQRYRIVQSFGDFKPKTNSSKNTK